MEANVSDQIRHFYGSSSLNRMGKRTLEWDLNDWKWDGELFVATPLNCKPSSYRSHQFLPETGGSSNSSSTCSDDVNMGSNAREQELLQQSIRGVVAESGDANLSLKLGGHGVAGGEMEVKNWEGGSCKKSKAVGAVCQVDDCGAELSKAKDYHRRHKVCEMHSKATRALVGNVIQRFCQQCSRFHALQEFDEGKRSCRRRLAGHNKRRRKTNPLNVVPGASISDDQSNSYLLLNLLKILTDLHSNKSDHTINQDLLSHLLRSFAENKNANGGNNISEAVSALLTNGQQEFPKSDEQLTTAVQEMPLKGSPSADVSPAPSTLVSIKDSPPGYSVVPSTTVGQIKHNNFDLNDVFVDSDDGSEDLEAFRIPSNNGTSVLGCPSWMQQEVHNSSPPQVSRNSDSGSAQSPSSSSGDQIRTDRIVFKLFGKEPSDFPLVLRTQILDWLAHTPTDIESYIRPGCIVLTIYLRLSESLWDELCLNLTSSLSRLVDISEDSFWSTGWVYVRVQDQIAFIYDGHIIIDETLPYISTASRILSVKPIAIPIAEKASFSIKGFNVSPPNSRLLCAIEGQYLAQENIHELLESSNSHNGSEKLQVINYSCSFPTIIGRGFVEVEEDNGLGNDFYPFIVAESDMCSEIRMLESTLELELTEGDEASKNSELDTKSEAMEFILEMGWLLRRTQMRLKLDYADRKTEDVFDFDRLKWLVQFALDHEWCAVVKKLLNIVFDGTVGSGEHESVVEAIADMGILHRAVRRNSRPLVELLLRYVPEGTSTSSIVKGQYLFTPSATGPAGLTPLHIAAGRDGADAVLDALTDDPEMVGIKAWKSARDSTGASPEDYARLRGHYSYIHLVQRKTSKKSVDPRHVILDIPNALISDSKPNKTEATTTQKSTFQISKFPMLTGKGPCKACYQKLIYRTVNTSMAYKPAMLSMVAVAAVCVCVALLFKSCPEVMYVFRPFRWENLEYGSS